MAIDTRPTPVITTLDDALAGLDALERASRPPRDRRSRRLLRATWPKFATLACILVVWQIAVWVHWQRHILQTPAHVGSQLVSLLSSSLFWQSCWATAQQAGLGYLLVIVIGGLVGTAVARIRVLRSAVGSLITGMQTMPSVLWYPLGYMVFGQTSKAIILMMVLGAAPAVANGFISGIDQVPPGLVRAGRILGARGIALDRHVILPAAFPSILGGLKQGWAFAWHALMAGEFLITLTPLSLGGRTVNALSYGDYATVVALMVVIVAVGIAVDGVFSWADRNLRSRYGLIEASAS